jgi:nucleotide-binding universal stress UspA family protein
MTPRSTLRKALGRYKGHEIDLQTATAVGHPAEQIIYRAEADGIDLIILGRRGALDDLPG